MADFIKLNWVIESTNQTEQRIYRKIDDNPEELLVTIPAPVTEYNDTTALDLMTTQASYRVESVGIYRGVETIKTSLTETYTVPIQSNGLAGMTSADKNLSVVSLEPINLWVNGIAVETESTESPYQYTSRSTGEARYVQLSSVDNVSPLPTVQFLSGLETLEEWGTLGLGVVSLGPDILTVPDHIPESLTNLSGMFANSTKFNDPNVALWDVSNVTNMSNMFLGCTIFSQDLSKWCVSLIYTRPTSFNDYAPLLTADKLPVWGTCPRGEIYADDESILELQQGTFITKSGGTLTFANGTSTVFTPGTSTTYNVTAGQAGVANFKGTFVNYTVGGTSLVKVLNYPHNATDIRHDKSPNLIEVPAYLPPNVTVLTSTFSNCSSFNHPNVTLWNVSKVTTMLNMFYNCTNFNQPLDSWDVSKVINMSSMFSGCSVFNQPLNSWNTSKVTSMIYMFSGCKVFNQSLNDWDTGNVTNMNNMFSGCTNFNQDIGNWDVSNVTNMGYMFSGCSVFNRPLNSWNTSQVTNMNNMFRGCKVFDQDLSKWCVPNNTSLPDRFDYGATNWTLPRPVWGTCPSAVVTITEPMNIVMGETLTAQFTTVPAMSRNDVTWELATGDVATVDPATGVITPVAPGEDIITVTINGVNTDIATVTVTASA